MASLPLMQASQAHGIELPELADGQQTAIAGFDWMTDPALNAGIVRRVLLLGLGFVLFATMLDQHFLDAGIFRKMTAVGWVLNLVGWLRMDTDRPPLSGTLAPQKRNGGSAHCG